MKLKYEIRGNLLLITEYPLHLYYKLRDVFTYKKIGYDRQASRRTVTPEIVASGYDASGNVVDLSGTAIPKQIISFRGYEDRLLEFVVKNKLEIDKTETKLIDDEVFEPNWDNVPEGFEFRYKQRELLELIGTKPGGIIVFPVGGGKTTSLGILPLIYPKARILISTYRQQVYQTIGEQIRKFNLPGTKWFIQGYKGVGFTQKNVSDARIVVCGNRSIPRVLGYNDKFDIFVGDEVHGIAADDAFRIVSTMVRPKMFGLTGSPNRSDGAQFRLLGLFGPTILDVDMRKGMEKGFIVPVTVYWCPVNLQYDPTANCHSAYVKHRGIWYNTVRNNLIAGAAKLYDENTQVLIIVETIKHAFALKKLLPDYFVASSETPNLDKIRGAFAKGTMKKIIATGVFREGVDFKQLQVLINATGVRSEIANIQLTGRVVRTSDGKERGIVHDFADNWSHQFKHFSDERKRLYDKLGYEQLDIQPSSLLIQQ